MVTLAFDRPIPFFNFNWNRPNIHKTNCSRTIIHCTRCFNEFARFDVISTKDDAGFGLQMLQQQCSTEYSGCEFDSGNDYRYPFGFFGDFVATINFRPISFNKRRPSARTQDSFQLNMLRTWYVARMN